MILNFEELDDLEEMIRELCELERGLSLWEVEFVESMSHQIESGSLSQKQIDKVEELWRKHVQ